MSKLVEFISKHQNDKKKLNAGQIREMIKLVIVGVNDGVNRAESMLIIDEIRATPFAIKMAKEKEIAHHEQQLKVLKATKEVV